MTTHRRHSTVSMTNDEQRTAEVVDYDPRWRGQFEAEAALLQRILGDEVMAIHHVGSTAIPTIKAKPIVDVLVEVADIGRIDAYDEAMSAEGHEPRGEYGLPGRRYFPKTVDGQRTHHVHIYQVKAEAVQRHVAFRDYMIAHPSQARAYNDLKEYLVDAFGGDLAQYIAGKDAFCKQMEAAAVAWQGYFAARALQTERLRLVPLTAAQLHFCRENLSQLEAELHMRIAPSLLPQPVLNAIRIKLIKMADVPDERHLWYTYWLAGMPERSIAVSLIGFKGAPNAAGEVEIGYGVDAALRGRGFATEAARALVDWALAQEDCTSVIAWADIANWASNRVLAKLGFEQEIESQGQRRWRLRKERIVPL